MTSALTEEKWILLMFGLTSPMPPSHPWPLRFKRHNFGARCYRTLRCSVIYDRFQFVPENLLSGPSGEPIRPEDRAGWSAGYIVGDEFADPVRIEWTSMDGRDHRATVDLAEIFGDRLVRHCVARDEISESWLAAKSLNPVTAQILVEVDDATINVYMKAIVFANSLRDPDNPHSNVRNDVVLAWAHTY